MTMMAVCLLCDLRDHHKGIFDANPQLRNTNLDNMLIKPVQRICKYPLLLDQLLKYTSFGDAEYNNIERAKLAIEKVCEFIDVKILEYATRMKLQEVERQVSDWPEGFSLVPPSNAQHQRQYLKEWECRVSSKGDTRPSKIYLFDDMLLWTASGLLDGLMTMTRANQKKLRYRCDYCSSVYAPAHQTHTHTLSLSLSPQGSCTIHRTTI